MTTVRRWTGTESRALRHALRLSVRDFATTLGVAVRTITKWEACGQHIDLRPDSQALLDTALKRADPEVQQRFHDSTNPTEGHSRTPAVADQGRRRPVGFVGDAPGIEAIAPEALPLDGQVDVLSTMRWLRSADSQLGGGHLYPAVARYLQQVLAPRLFTGGIDPQAGDLFAAAAALSEMAGWMAHDAGGDTYAWQHFGQALAMARVSRDDQLHSHVLGSLSHLASHAGRPEQAIQLAQQGQRVGRGRSHPGALARLHAMQARGHAALHQSDLCREHLQRADTTLAATSHTDVSPWVNNFDHASLATEVARCLQHFGQWHQAQDQVEQVIAFRPPIRVRSRSLAQLTLARVLVAQGQPDEACGAADEVLDATRMLGSDLIIQQFDELDRRLAPYSGSPAVATFRERARHELRLRRLFHHWQPAPGPHQNDQESL